MPEPPREEPIGAALWKGVSIIHRAFDDALVAAGGSRPTWFIMLALKQHPGASQREIAAQVGIQGATLTHHLDAMEADGLLTRERDPANRRVHVVHLTDKGEKAFLRLRDAAMAFDRKMRSGIPDAEITKLRETLASLVSNATGRSVSL